MEKDTDYISETLEEVNNRSCYVSGTLEDILEFMSVVREMLQNNDVSFVNIQITKGEKQNG